MVLVDFRSPSAATSTVIGKEVINVFFLKPTVTPGADAISLEYPLITPSADGVDVQVQDTGHLARGQHRVEIIVGHVSLPP